MYKVKKWRENTGQGVTKGWFTLVVNDFEINDCSLVKGAKGDFIGFPSRSYEKDGETKYSSIVWIPDEQRRYAFQDWCLKELEKTVGVEVPTKEEDEQIPF